MPLKSPTTLRGQFVQAAEELMCGLRVARTDDDFRHMLEQLAMLAADFRREVGQASSQSTIAILRQADERLDRTRTQTMRPKIR
jgi:hypothetical protein